MGGSLVVVVVVKWTPPWLLLVKKTLVVKRTTALWMNWLTLAWEEMWWFEEEEEEEEEGLWGWEADKRKGRIAFNYYTFFVYHRKVTIFFVPIYIDEPLEWRQRNCVETEWIIINRNPGKEPSNCRDSGGKGASWYSLVLVFSGALSKGQYHIGVLMNEEKFDLLFIIR